MGGDETADSEKGTISVGGVVLPYSTVHLYDMYDSGYSATRRRYLGAAYWRDAARVGKSAPFRSAVQRVTTVWPTISEYDNNWAVDGGIEVNVSTFDWWPGSPARVSILHGDLSTPRALAGILMSPAGIPWPCYVGSGQEYTGRLSTSSSVVLRAIERYRCYDTPDTAVNYKLSKEWHWANVRKFGDMIYESPLGHALRAGGLSGAGQHTPWSAAANQAAWE